MSDSDFEVRIERVLGKGGMWFLVAMGLIAVSTYAYNAGYTFGSDLAHHQSSPSGGGGSAQR